MNKNTIIRVNSVLKKRDIHPDQFKFINCVKFHPKESKRQRLKKFEIASALYDEGKPFMTEVWTTDRKKRLDVLNLIDDIDYEITLDIKKENQKSYKGDKIIEV